MSTPKRNPSISVIIPAFNEEINIEKTLKSVIKSHYPKHLLEIVVVDNNSTDGTAKIAQDLNSKVLTLKNGNVGAVRNLGAESSNSEVFVFLDADCIVDNDWLSKGVSILESDANLVCGGPYKSRNNANWIERLWLLENPNHPRIQPDLLGGCIFIRSSSFRTVNGFNEEMTSGEDSDLSKRLRNSGYRVKIFPELSVVHLGNPSTLLSFASRQIWHSENYLKFIKSSILDYTFWITVFFSASLILSLLFFATGKYSIMGYTLLTTIALTLSISAKRILLTKYKIKKTQDLAGIFILDYLYLLSRTIGIFKSLFQ